MRAILIDPAAKLVSEVEYGGDYKEIYRLIECEYFTVVRIEGGNAVFIDDVGLLREEPGPFFTVKGYGQPLAGKGLILGTDNDGESIGTALSIERVLELVSFPDDVAFSHFDPIPEGTRTKIFGHDAPVYGNRAIFKRK